ncbi:MAG: AMP-binding enzyme [Planctomycetaceae bacterium]
MGREEAVRAIIVLRSPCSRGELMDLCRRSLAEFKVPRVVDFVDSIPS